MQTIKMTTNLNKISHGKATFMASPRSTRSSEECKSEIKMSFNKLMEAEQSELSTEFSADDVDMQTPKFSELSMILEKGESKYEPLQQQDFNIGCSRLQGQKANIRASDIPHLVPTEEECEILLNKLEEKSAALKEEVERLEAFSNMASGVTNICDEVEQMLDNFVETTEKELNQSFQAMMMPKKSPRGGNRSHRGNNLPIPSSRNPRVLQKGGSTHVSPSPRNDRVPRAGSYHV